MNYQQEYAPNGYSFIFTNQGIQAGQQGRVLYFDPNGNPVTTQQWQQAVDPTGQTYNTQDIDHAANLGFNTYDSYRLNNGMPTLGTTHGSTPNSMDTLGIGETPPANFVPDLPNASTGHLTNTTPSTQSTVSAGSNGSTGWQPRYYEGTGQYYTDEASYNAAVNKDINDTYNKSVQNAKDLYSNGLITLDQLQQNIAQTRQNLSDQLQTALQGTSGYFNSVSPEATQSQEGTYMNKINTQNQTAQTNLGPTLPSQIESLSPDQLSKYSNNISDVGNAVRYFQNLGTQEQQNFDTATANKNKALADFGNAQLAEASSSASTTAPANSNTYNDWLNNYTSYMNSLPNTTPISAPSIGAVSAGGSAPAATGTPLNQFANPTG